MQENYIDKQVSYLFERMIYWYDLINLLTPVTDVIHGVLKHFFKNQHSCYIYSILTCRIFICRHAKMYYVYIEVRIY